MLTKHLPVDRSSIDPVPISYVPGTNTGSIHDWWIVAQPEHEPIIIVASILTILPFINVCVFIDKVVDVNRCGDRLCGGIFWLRKRVFKLRRLVWLNYIFYLIITLI